MAIFKISRFDSALKLESPYRRSIQKKTGFIGKYISRF